MNLARRIVSWLQGAVATPPGAQLVQSAWGKLEAQDLAGALEAADEALDRAGPDHPAARCVRAWVHSARHEWQAAAEDARVAFAGDPSLTHAAFARAFALEQLWDQVAADAAWADAERASEEAAVSVPAWLETLAQVRLERHDLAGAEAALERRRDGPSRVRAEVLRSLGRLQEARAELDALVREAPGASDPLSRRAQVRILEGDLTGALLDAEAAILRPHGRSDPWPYIRRAGLLEALGRSEATLADLRTAQARCPRIHHLPAWRTALGEPGVPRPRLPGPPWPGRLVAGAAGELPPVALVEAASGMAGPRMRARSLQEAHHLLGLLAERQGQREAAREHHRAVVELGDTGHLEYVWSFARLIAWGEKPEHRPPA